MKKLTSITSSAASKKSSTVLKKKASDLRNDNNTGARFRHFLHELGNFVATVFKTVFKIVSKLVYLFLIFISIVVLIAMSIAMFSSNSIHIKTDNVEAHYGLKEVLYSVFTNNTYVNLSMLALFLAVGIPFIMILYKAISRLAGVKKNIRALNMTALFLWIVGIGLGFYLVATGAKNFQEGGKSSETVDIKQPSGDIIYLNLSEKGEWKHNQTNREDAWFFYRFNDGDKDLGFAQVDIKPSPTDSFAIVINKISRGQTKKEAMFLASELNYNFTQNDSVINFSNFFELKEKTPWRAQKVKIEVLVPTNKKVHLNRNMKHLIYDVGNVQNTYDWDMVGRTWIMTEQGLDCVDCRGLEMNSNEAIRSRHPKNHVHDVKIEIHEDGPGAPPEPGHVNPPPSPGAPR